MPFWVYGRDRESGEPTEFFSDAANEAEARSQASEQGIVVERIEAAPESSGEIPEPVDGSFERGGPDPQYAGERAESGGTTELTHAPRSGFVWFCLIVAQFLCVIACISAVVVALVGLLNFVFRGQEDDFFRLVYGLCVFFYSVAMYAVFGQARHHRQTGTLAERTTA